MKENSIKVASLFCGCGGSDLGLIGGFTYLKKDYARTPFEIVYANDFDSKAVETYSANFTHKAVCADVCKEDFDHIPDVDLVVGGFPCQSFSTVNPTKDTDDDRAHLYKQVVRILKAKKPKVFVCENVKGLFLLYTQCKIIFIIQFIKTFQCEEPCLSNEVTATICHHHGMGAG